MISEGEIQRLVELYAVTAEAPDPLDPNLEKHREAFDLEVIRLFSRIARPGVTPEGFKAKVRDICIKRLHRDLPPEQRRARETTI